MISRDDCARRDAADALAPLRDQFMLPEGVIYVGTDDGLVQVQVGGNIVGNGDNNKQVISQSQHLKDHSYEAPEGPLQVQAAANIVEQGSHNTQVITQSQSLTLGTTAAANTVALSGTGTFALVTPAGGAAGKPLADAASQSIRSSLVKQYNDIITQITTTSQDASFNGINLLNGDNL